MKSKSYICTMCKHKFTRKSNAFRHNFTVHSDLGKIVLNSTNSSRSIDGLKYTNNDDKNRLHKFKILQSIYKSREADDYFDIPINEDKNKTDSKIMKIIVQMFKPYLELEASLNYMHPQDKAKVLSNSFISSLLSYNPVKSLREISEIYRSIQALKVIAGHLSVAKSIPMRQATALVEDAIRNSSLIHRINN